MSSVASKNLFSVLDDEPAVAKAGAVPTTRKSTSSKKTDEAPVRTVPGASAPKQRAANVNGNEAAFKDKSVGRNANRSRATGDDSGRKPPRKTANRPDRKSQTGKVDSDKKVKMGWGDDNKELEEEQAAAAIAKDERSQDAQAEQPVVEEEPDNTKTLEEYLAELSTKSVKTDRSVRAPNANAVDSDNKWTAVEKTAEADLFVGAEAKKEKVKARKEKSILEPEITFVSESSSSGRPSRRDNTAKRSDRGDRKPGARPRKNAPKGKPTGGARRSMNADLGSKAEFPTL